MTVLRNEKGRFRAADAKNVDIRSKEDVPKLDSMLKSGAPTFILIYADWCGHCHRYLPTWSDLEKTPGRTANMARVHYDMQENVPAIANAKIEGYPSVVKVLPTGKLEEYKVPESEEATNAIPNMRDIDSLKAELTDQKNPGLQAGIVTQTGGSRTQSGGSVLNAFVGAIQAAGPTALLLLAHGALQTRKARTGGSRSFKTPKNRSRRASTRRNRSFRRRR